MFKTNKACLNEATTSISIDTYVVDNIQDYIINTGKGDKLLSHVTIVLCEDVQYDKSHKSPTNHQYKLNMNTEDDTPNLNDKFEDH